MLGIALGAASFFVVFWVDAVSLNQVRFLKPALWCTATALSIAGILLVLFDPVRLDVPTSLAAPAWVLAVLFCGLLLYSLFIEIPFAEAYIRRGSPRHVVRRGTYALCRHPGVLWLTGMLLSLFIATGALRLLAAIPVWIGLDVVYVVLQEKVFFRRQFGAEYAAYRDAVPMIIPTRRSVHACSSTIFRKESGQE